MTVQDFMSPNETIKYTYSDLVTHADQAFNLHVTNHKLILHNITGMLFKKENAIAHKLEDILTMKYHEKGIIGKKGILEIHTIDKKIPLKGRPDSMKALWQELQKYIKTD